MNMQKKKNKFKKEKQSAGLFKKKRAALKDKQTLDDLAIAYNKISD